LEILGIYTNGFVNIRIWVTLIPRTTWLSDDIVLLRRRDRDKIWIHPEVPGISRSAGSTDFIPFTSFRGRNLRAILEPEQPTIYLDDAQILHKNIARQVYFCADKRLPSKPDSIHRASTPQDDIQLFQGCAGRKVEVFVDGSMKISATALDHAFL